MSSSARRLVSTSRLRFALVATVALCCVAPTAASAATRYASPTGAGASPCLATAPCSIETALDNSGSEGLANGDTVLLAPGTYHPSGQLNVFRLNVTISGEPGRAPPLIEAGGERGLLDQNVATIRDLRIHSPSTTTYGLVLTRTGTVVERVESTGAAAQACAFNDLTARDTLCATTAAGGAAVSSTFSAGVPITQKLKLFNVTAIGALGIDVVTNESATIEVDAVNSIFQGGEFDVAAESQAPTTANVEIELSRSNFATVGASGGVVVTLPTENGNQEAAPVFADEAGGDYREAAGSPTRLAGDLAAVLTGETDLAGNPRTTNCAGTVGVDIGAYQYECPAPESTPTLPGDEKKPDNPIGTQVTPLAPPAMAPSLPSLSKLALKPAKFTDTGKAPKGTTISFALAAAASVKLEVLGKKTVEGKRKTVTLGTLGPISGKVGANSVKFSGKVKGKPLAPGSYALRATASATGGSSAPATKTFTVLAPTA